ncbi:NUDIX hydrolase, partial [Staphylococcus aureus]
MSDGEQAKSRRRRGRRRGRRATATAENTMAAQPAG